MLNSVKKNKDLLLKIIVIVIGFISIYCLYTSSIYIYDNFSFRAFSLKLWIGIIAWIVFFILGICMSYFNSKSIKKYVDQVKYFLRNIVLLLMISILLVYKIGNAVIKLYQLNNQLFNYIIYGFFALIFIAYAITLYLFNKKYHIK